MTTRAKLGQIVMTEYRDRFGDDQEVYGWLTHVLQRAFDIDGPGKEPKLVEIEPGAGTELWDAIVEDWPSETRPVG